MLGIAICVLGILCSVRDARGEAAPLSPYFHGQAVPLRRLSGLRLLLAPPEANLGIGVCLSTEFFTACCMK